MPGRYYGAPQLNLHPITEAPFGIGEFNFLPVQVMHQEMKVFGYRIGDFTYITDANYISPAELDKVRGSKVVVINALRNSRHVSHFSLSEALEILQELKPEVAYLTHISHFLGKYESVEPKLPDGVYLAYDGLQIEI
jgi:phosphoribosyl 1,2-cyclic phosphate phosphodiesterase